MGFWKTFVRRLDKPLPLAAYDTLTLCLAVVLSLSVRNLDQHATTSAPSLVWGILMYVVVLHAFAWKVALYRRRYRVGSKEEVLAVTGVLMSTTFTVTLFSVLWPGVRPLPLSVCALTGLLGLLAMLAGRSAIRSVQESDLRSSGFPALVFGLGVAGLQILDTMRTNPESPYIPVGLLDDDTMKHNLRVRGLQCFGGVDAIGRAARATGAKALIVAVVSGSSSFYQRVSAAAHDNNLELKIVPPLSSLLTQSAAIKDLRDVDVTDLLGRREIETDLGQIHDFLVGRRVLVTGAGGSIGSELCRQLSKFPLSELIMVDRDESSLHSLQLALYGRAMLDTTDVVLLDIRDAETVRSVFQVRKPDVVFHAAALKHLPMLEQYPDEAWKTNVLGTRNVLNAAVQCNAEIFVNISTDKAANPVSQLGFSKRLAERITSDFSSKATGRFISVRFGNVLGSRGSVLTAFANQISHGGPVTVTSPDVTRYFMTISEAVQLTLQAAAIGKSGETLVLDMGEPVRIVDVAEQMIAIAKRHVDITFTGLRVGEKIHEDLFDSSEEAQATSHPLITAVNVARLRSDDLDGLFDASTMQSAALHTESDSVIPRQIAVSESEGAST